jgi:hypothetical protein
MLTMYAACVAVLFLMALVFQSRQTTLMALLLGLETWIVAHMIWRKYPILIGHTFSVFLTVAIGMQLALVSSSRLAANDLYLSNGTLTLPPAHPAESVNGTIGIGAGVGWPAPTRARYPVCSVAWDGKGDVFSILDAAAIARLVYLEPATIQEGLTDAFRGGGLHDARLAQMHIQSQVCSTRNAVCRTMWYWPTPRWSRLAPAVS